MHELKARKLVKSYGPKTVVRSVSLSIQSREIVGLLGPNGAGKTTLFYMTLGLVDPDEGDVFLDGKSIRGKPLFKRARMGIGYLPQEPSAFRKLTVRQNLELVLEAWNYSRGDIRDRVNSTLRAMGIEQLSGVLAVKLSGGERRRLEIARSLCLRPRFILLDEPFAGIDPIAISEFQIPILSQIAYELLNKIAFFLI